MMTAARYLAAVAAAVLLHAVGTLLWPDLPRATDLFLVVTVFYALEGRLMPATFGGLVAGLASDALTGGPYGLAGLADTILGYGSAFMAQRLVIRRASSVFLLFALAAAAQQAIMIAVTLVLFPERGGFPGYTWPVVKVASVGLLGAMLFVGRARLRVSLEKRRTGRAGRLR